MVFVNLRFTVFITILVLMGIASAVLNSVLLLILALIGLFLLILFTPEYKYLEALGVFSLAPLICTPFNIGLSIRIANALFDEMPYVIIILLAITCGIILTCLEVTVLEMLSSIIWREQDDVNEP